MGKPLPPDKRKRIEAMLAEGFTISETARRCQVHVNTVSGIKNAHKRPVSVLSKEAQRALEDFEYFRRRYLGRMSTPWQEQAGYRMLELLSTPDREYVVCNVGPGSGKSTTFTHDIPAWIATRNRANRCMIGSASASIAKSYTARLRRTFDREHPVKAKTDDVQRGLGCDAEATLQGDYGRFKPANHDLWRIDEFVLAQPDGSGVEDKEPSFVSYGRDSGFLGGRFDLVIWDDLVTRKTLRTEESRDELIRWFEDEAETRIEPGGLFLLQGQRMANNDLYRHALDMLGADAVALDEIMDGPDPDDPDDRSRHKYHHIVYKAHYDENCKGHPTAADKRKGVKDETPAWPDGCLLDPKRLPYSFLLPLMRDKAEKFSLLYQQEDVDSLNSLVKETWVMGSLDPDTGVQHPGCLDRDRPVGTVPTLVGERYNIVTVDPSPSKYWSVQWWTYHPDSKRRFLVDILRTKANVNDLLTRDEITREFSGILDTWLDSSRRQNNTITHVIFEKNGAQRFFLDQPFVQAWAAMNFVTLMGHVTHASNKSDPDYGVQMLGPIYQHGLVRLPWDGPQSIKASRYLVDEVTRWPEANTEDCVMAQWFLERNLPHIAVPATIYRFKRPSWIGASA